MVLCYKLKYFDVIGKQPAVDGFCCVRHEAASFKRGFLEKPGQSSTVV